MERSILLADISSFFASCHQAAEPSLREKPVVVTGDPKRRAGICLAASYPVKGTGVKTGMPIWQVLQLCPEAILIQADYPLYFEFNTRILKIFRQYTDLVEVFSIDESFIDVTGVRKLFGSALEVATSLRQRINDEIGVMCNVGIGPNKLLAKMACGLEKPNRINVLNHQDVPLRMWPLPVRKLFGVGSRYEKHFRYLNIHTIGDLAAYPLELLKRRWGIMGEVLWWSAQGVDNSPVDPHSLDLAKSIGHQTTLPRDCRGFNKIKAVMLELSDTISRRARLGGYSGKTVSLTLRDTNLEWLSRSKSMPGYSNLAEDIYSCACQLLHRHWQEEWAVRLVGLGLSNLVSQHYQQPDLFGKNERLTNLALACDKIRNRFGDKSIKRAACLREEVAIYEES